MTARPTWVMVWDAPYLRMNKHPIYLKQIRSRMTSFLCNLTSARVPLFLLTLLWTKHASYLIHFLQITPCSPTPYSEMFRVWIGCLGQITLVLSDWCSQLPIVASSHNCLHLKRHSGDSWKTTFPLCPKPYLPACPQNTWNFHPSDLRDVPSKYRHDFDWER